MNRKCKWISAVRVTIPWCLAMLMILIAGFNSPVHAQQVKITSGAYFKNSGANIVINAKVVNAGTITNSGTSNIKLTGDWQNDGAYTPTGCTVTLRGTSTQDIGGANETSFENLILNNNNGAILSEGITINNTLTFTSGKITTGSNALTLISSASVTGAGAGKYVFGNLKWTLPGSGSPSKTFYIGDATNYTPILVDFSSITAGGTITGSTTAGAHPNGTTSGISGVKRVNRYWTLLNTGVSFNHYDATFTFVSGDILGGADPASFIIRNWTSASWLTTSISTRTSTTTKITGLTTFNDFLAGEAGPGCIQSTPPVSASATPSTICSGTDAELSLSGGGGGTYELIEWFTSSCGGTAVGTGNNLPVSPSATTTYYGRYSNGVPCTYSTTCASVVVTVIASPNAVIDTSGPTKFCQEGSVDLTASGGVSYLWSNESTNATITCTASGLYTVTVTGSNSCTDSISQFITVYPPSVGGTVSGETVVCTETNSTLLELTGHIGGVVKWQSSTNEIDWDDISDTSATYIAADITVNTWFRAAVQSGSCSVDYSEPALITITQTGNWLGLVSTDWNDDSNWCGGIPGSTTDVVIFADAPNMPEIGSGNGICRDLTINNGASLTIIGNNILSIYGDWSGSGTFIPNNSTVSYSGSGAQNIAVLNYHSLNLRNAGTKTFGSGTTGIDQSFTVSESAVADAMTNSTTIDFNGSGAQYLAAIDYYNLTFSNDGIKSFSTGITGIAHTFTISGTASAYAGAFNCTINYNGSDAQSVVAINYRHLSFNNTGVKTLPSTSFSLAGNWTNNSSVTAGSSTVILNGNIMQTIGGSSSTTFNAVTLNNADCASLDASQTINSTLTFTNGKLVLGAYDLLLGSSSTISGISSTKYIVTNGTGALRQHVVNNATNVIFPVGNTPEYLPVTLNLTVGSTADDFKIRVADVLSTTYDANDNPTGLTITSGAVTKAWSIKESTAGGSNATVTLQWNLEDEGSFFDRTLCDVSHYTGGAWVYSALAASSGSGPYTRAISGIISFSPFAVFGSASIGCTVNQIALCAGGSVSVDYTATGGIWNSGNVFTAQLSDIEGSFTFPINIGSLTSRVSGTISATIPSYMANGIGYRIRVVSNNPSITGQNNGIDLIVDPPSIGGTVAYAQTICGGSAPADLTLSGNTGTVIKWQKASDVSFTTPVDIAETSTTLSGAIIGLLTTDTWFRAVVQSGGCFAVYSTSVKITISGWAGNWLGTINTDWNMASNWCGGIIPTAIIDVTINSGVTYMPAIGWAGGVCRDITIGSGATLTINASNALTVNGILDNSGTITMTAGTSSVNTSMFMAGNVTNNPGATITATGNYTRLMFSSSSAQTLTNNGTVTSPVTSFNVSNSHASGLTLAGSNNIVVTRINLFYGAVTNSNKITVGSGGTSSSVIQRGIAGNTSVAGSFNGSPTFNIGTGGLTLLYDNGNAAYNSGNEIPSGTHTARYVYIYNAADVTLNANLTITDELAFAGGTGTQKFRIGANTLTLGGIITYTAAGEFYGGSSSNLTMNGATTLHTIINGLNNLVINANTNIAGAVTVNGTLTLTSGVLIHESNLTMASGTTISRSGGSLATAPVFAGTVNLDYNGGSAITTGYEMPTGSGVLNNLATNAGGVIQDSIPGITANLLTDTFTNLTNWTGDIGNSYNQYSAVVSAYAGGTANEGRYMWGSNSGSVYTASIYRSINTTGYTSLDIRWKQFIDNYDGTIYPYTLKVQCATSSSGPWTDIYSLSPTGTANIGPETKIYYDWTTNVGGTFYIRYYITGKTYGIDYWYFDDLIIESPSAATPSTVTINGTLDLTNGTYEIDGNSLVMNGGKSGSSGMIGSTTSNLAVGGTGSNLTLPAITNGLNNFTITRPNGVTASEDMSINGVLQLGDNPSSTHGCLEMGTDTLFMGASATTIGSGDVTGIVKRTTLVAGTVYSFGNHYTTITFQNVGTLPADVSVKISIGSAPEWKTSTIQRIYDFMHTGGSGSFATLDMHYLDTELNGNTENTLVIWDGHLPSPPGQVDEHGRSNYNMTNNWVELSGMGVSYFCPTSFDSKAWTLGNSAVTSFTWNGSASSLWVYEDNWTPSGVPSDLSDVIIPDSSETPNDPTLNSTLSVKRLMINSGGILNSVLGSTVTISGGNGAWINNGGIFNPSTSTVIFTNAAATLSGITNFYNLTINSGAGLEMGSNTTMRIGGTMTNNGTLNAVLNSSLVEYNGSGQTIINPNGSPSGYHDLILSGSGTKTLPGTAMSVAGNFSLSGSASATAGAGLTIGGNIVIGSGTTFAGSSYTHYIAGNWANNGGTFTAGTSIVVFNGSVAQIINGNSSTTFNNLTLNNANGISIGNNETINGVLTFTSGKIKTASNILSLGSSASVSGAGSGKYVYGKLLWNIPTGSPSRNFVIGDTTNYTPINVAFSNVTTPGTLLGTTTGTEHPDITGSGINALSSVNRYWSLTNTSTAFTDYSATFAFVAADIDPGANYEDFIVKRWNGSTWNSATTGTRTSTSTQTTGETLFSDFAVGEACVQSGDPTSASASATTICNGDTTILSVTGGGGGSNESIQWYTGSCGGTAVGNGNDFRVSPTTTTTYWGRYENSSSCAYNTACVSVAITVLPVPSDPVSASAASEAICNGESTTLTLIGGGGDPGQTITWYSGSCAGTSEGTGNELSVSPTTTTTYYGRYEVSDPCSFNTACASVQVTVYEIPTVTWDESLEAQCITATHVPLSGGTPTGGSYSGAGVTGAMFNAYVAGAGTHTLTYTYTSSEGCTNSANNTITVNPLQKISGTFTYYNTSNTLLTEADITVNVYLSSDLTHSTSLGTAVTNGSGLYEIVNLCSACNYDIVATSTHTTEGAINTTDAAQANYWGPHPYSIEKVRFHAGDVAGPNRFIGGTDAGRIQSYFVYGTAFDRSSWTFWKAGFSISHNPTDFEPEFTEYYPSVNLASGSNATANIYGLCTGDFNRSFNPSLTKSASSTLDLIYAGNRQVSNNQEFDLPIRLVNASSVGAVSLILNFPTDLVEVQEVLMDGAGGQLDWAVKGDELRIGWNSQNPLYLSANSNLVTLKLKTKAAFTTGNSIRITLVANPLNELADELYDVIGDAVLGVDVIDATAVGIEEVHVIERLNMSCYPNPFSDYTNITYTLPFEGRIILEINSILGNRISILLDEVQTAGDHKVKFDTYDLPSGVYTATLRLKSANNELMRTIKLINNK